ncbi:hypothetical protein FGG08_007663, partial [Glutinoglossum americanum]
MGGGVGGLLYSLRGNTPSYNHSNHRGDVIAKTNAGGTTTWSANYDAFGAIKGEFGSTLDRQKHSTKEQDPTGLVNVHHRYLDPEAGIWMTRDPLGFGGGTTNLYQYCGSNPWSSFDPEGLEVFWSTDKNGKISSSYYPPGWEADVQMDKVPWLRLPGKPQVHQETLNRFNLLNSPIVYDDFDYRFLRNLMQGTDIYRFGSASQLDIDIGYRKGYISWDRYPVFAVRGNQGTQVLMDQGQVVTEVAVMIATSIAFEAVAINQMSAISRGSSSVVSQRSASWWADVAGEWRGWREGFADTGRFRWTDSRPFARDGMRASLAESMGAQSYDNLHHRIFAQGGTRGGAGRLSPSGFFSEQYGRYVPNIVKNTRWNITNMGQPMWR